MADKKATSIDLSGSSFNITLHEVDAPADQKRWTVQLENGELTVRLWNDAVCNCRTVVIGREGVTPQIVRGHCNDR